MIYGCNAHVHRLDVFFLAAACISIYFFTVHCVKSVRSTMQYTDEFSASNPNNVRACYCYSSWLSSARKKWGDDLSVDGEGARALCMAPSSTRRNLLAVRLCGGGAHSAGRVGEAVQGGRAGCVVEENAHGVQAHGGERLLALGRALGLQLDMDAGLVPLFLCATVGTTQIAAVDPVGELGAVAAPHGVRAHGDAACAGSALICPECTRVEAVESFSMNAHKWLVSNKARQQPLLRRVGEGAGCAGVGWTRASRTPAAIWPLVEWKMCASWSSTRTSVEWKTRHLCRRGEYRAPRRKPALGGKHLAGPPLLLEAWQARTFVAAMSSYTRCASSCPLLHISRFKRRQASLYD
uniref:Uncharacterized protein n=2 Tax=Aegilops tauschii subsp. strangulata TaxID=200361 RepID=A0A453EFA8_AEGTS